VIPSSGKKLSNRRYKQRGRHRLNQKKFGSSPSERLPHCTGNLSEGDEVSEHGSKRCLVLVFRGHWNLVVARE